MTAGQISLLRMLAVTLWVLQFTTYPLRAQQAPPESDGPKPSKISSLASAPDVQLFTGAASTSIKIELPPGRKNLTPSLVLQYRQGGAMGPYGVGWELPLGQVTRTPKFGALRCPDPGQDQWRFTVALPAGTVECVLEEVATNGLRRCLARVEGAFLQIQYEENLGGWVVRDKSGMTYRFRGKLSSCPVTDNRLFGVQHRNDGSCTSCYQGNCVDNCHDKCCWAAAWFLTEVEDANGNYVTLTYWPPGGNVRVPDVLPLPDTIEYGGHKGTLAHQFKVKFVWEIIADGRPPISVNVGGLTFVVYRRLRAIEVREEQPPGEGPLIRSYEFFYEPDPRGGKAWALRSVQLRGRGTPGQSREETPILTREDGMPAAPVFVYSRHFGRTPSGEEPGFQDTWSDVKPTGVSESWSETRRGARERYNDMEVYPWRTVRQLIDMNADAFPDLVEVAGPPGGPCTWSVRYYGRQPDGAFGFSDPQEWVVPDSTMCSIQLSREQRYIGAQESSSWLVETVVDMNGDGIPDWVRTIPREWPEPDELKVYLGYAPQGTTPGGFFAAIDWAHGGECNLKLTTTRYDHYSGYYYREEWSDLTDVNGDGLVDLVCGSHHRREFASSLWTVFYGRAGCTADNPGACGFVPPRLVSSYPESGNYWAPNFWAPWPFLRRGRVFTDHVNTGMALNDFRDIDGDGRPDAIGIYKNRLDHPAIDDTYDRPAELWVYRNTGGGLESSPMRWPFPEVDCPYPGWHEWGLEHEVQSGNGVSTGARALLDINHDGLVDVVTACPGQSHWLVNLNVGRGYAVDNGRLVFYSWRSPVDHVQRSWSGNKNIDGAVVKVTTEMTRTVDMNGDGLSDLLSLGVASGGTPSAYRLHLHGRDEGSRLFSDLLLASETGIGGATFLEYKPSTAWNHWNEWPGNERGKLPFVLWTVSRIIRDDGLCTTGGATPFPDCTAHQHGHTVVTGFAYASARYDPVDREFRGFGEVYESDAHTTRKTFFHQDAVRRGLPYKTELRFLGRVLLVASQDSWQCVRSGSPGTWTTAQCPPSLENDQSRWWARLTTTIKRELGMTGSTADQVYHQADNLLWDSYGNVTQTSKISATYEGHSVKHLTWVHEFTSYWRPPAGSDLYLADKPAYVETGNAYPTGSGNAPNIMQRKWFSYDSKGNLISTYDWLDTWSTGSQAPSADCPAVPAGGRSATGLKCVTTRFEYDTFGNLVKTFDALHTSDHPRITELVYDDRGLYPVLQKNALGHYVALEHDRGCGVRLSESTPSTSRTIPSDWPRARSVYDKFCRLVEVYSPRPDAGQHDIPRVGFTYRLGFPGRPTTVQVRQWVPTSFGDHDVAYDWLFAYQLVDSFGRSVQTQSQRLVGGARRWVADATPQYDWRGRVSQQYAPFVFSDTLAGNFVPPPTGTGVTLFSYDLLDRIYEVIKPNGEHVWYEFPTPWKKVTLDECWAWSGRCPNSGPGRTVEIFDGLGRLVEKQLWDGSTFKTKELYEYDVLGRLVASMQDDTPNGTGKPNTRRTARYDSLGRKIEATDPDTGSGSGAGVWRYGYDLVGNLIFQDDPKGSQSLRFEYDRLNRLVRRRQMATDSPSCAPGTTGCTVLREHRYRFDTPADDLLPNLCAGVCTLGNCFLGRATANEEYVGGELRSWDALCYDARGRTRVTYQSILARNELPALESIRARLEFQYDLTDRPWAMVYPDGEVVEYWYDEGTLEQIKGSSGGRPKLYLVDAKYDHLGRPTELHHGNDIIDFFEFGGAAENYRLVGLRSQLGNQAPLLSMAFTYWPDGLLGTVIDRQFPSGPLSNRALYRYDGLGHLIEVRDSEANGTYAVDGLRNLRSKDGMQINYGNSSRPHQPTGVTGGVAGNGMSVAHDANGNRTQLGSWTYNYDPLGRLVGAASGSSSVQFVYGAAGQRMAVVRGSGLGPRVTYSIGQWMDAGPGDQYTKYYYFGNRLLASQRVWQGWSFL